MERQISSHPTEKLLKELLLIQLDPTNNCSAVVSCINHPNEISCKIILSNKGVALAILNLLAHRHYN